jgi:hypothetical protein
MRTTKISVSIASLQAETPTWELPNMKQEWQPFKCVLSYIIFYYNKHNSTKNWDSSSGIVTRLWAG